MHTDLPDDWQNVLQPEFSKPYFQKLSASVATAYETDVIYPPQEVLFNAFSQCSFENVKVVLLGQDPYHGEGQAMGLAFSVPHETPIPPSLRNIYKELVTDIGTDLPLGGDLTHWAKQGVLLLNTTLTVPAHKPGGHQGLGWETFTDTVIRTISQQKKPVVFLLWGNYARSKAALIDTDIHLVLEAPHPSPLSAHRGFFGSKHFSQTNQFLVQHNLQAIDW